MNARLNKISILVTLIISINHLCSSVAEAKDTDPFKDAAKIYCKLDTVRIKKDAKLWTEYRGVFVDIPEEYENEKIILFSKSPSSGGGDSIKIKVKKAGNVYCLVTLGPGVAELEEEGWEVILKEGFTCLIHKINKIVVLKKYHAEGEYIIPSVYGIGTRIIIK